LPILSQGVDDIRDIRVTEKDALTGEYKGCMLDCTDSPKFYYFTWNMTDMVLVEKKLFVPDESSYDLRWITGIESCQFAGTEIFFAYIGDMDTNQVFNTSIELEKIFPVDSFSVFIDNQVITYMLDKSVSRHSIAL
jgi:hypothetical protein